MVEGYLLDEWRWRERFAVEEAREVRESWVEMWVWMMRVSPFAFTSTTASMADVPSDFSTWPQALSDDERQHLTQLATTYALSHGLL